MNSKKHRTKKKRPFWFGCKGLWVVLLNNKIIYRSKEKHKAHVQAMQNKGSMLIDCRNMK